MSTTAITLPTARPNVIGIFLREVRFELVRAMRTRAFSLSVLGFPIMFYCLFGLMLNRNATFQGGESVAKYFLGGYAVFGMVGAALFGIGVGVAADLSAGWLELKRASPMPPLAYLVSKCCTAMVFGMIIVTILSVLGIALGHVHLTTVEYLKMLGLTVAAAFPFASMGLALALIVPFNSAPGIANLLYLPMSFLGGVIIPLSVMPSFLQKIAPVLPTYHLAQLMLGIFGYSDRGHSALSHWYGLAGFTCLMLGVAWYAFRRREQNS